MSAKNFFDPTPHRLKPILDAFFDEVYSRADVFSYLADVRPGRYYHPSPSFETLTGYDRKDLLDEGVDFFLKRVDPNSILSVVEAQAKVFKEALEPGYDRSLPHVCEMHILLSCKDTRVVPFTGLFTPLRYLETGELDLVLCMAFPERSKVEDKAMTEKVGSLLMTAKTLYREVYGTHAESRVAEKKLVELVIKTAPRHILTAREKEVLYQIANGSSTKEIAGMLHITEHTVETHRKNMLTKLEASNVAELIKKASKLYWLE